MAEPFVPFTIPVHYPALAERFEEWIKEQGWKLSDYVEYDDGLPVRYVVPGDGPPPIPKQTEPVRAYVRDSDKDS